MSVIWDIVIILVLAVFLLSSNTIKMASVTFFFVVLAVGGFYFSLIDIYDFYHCQKWPITKGKLMSHSVDKFDDHHRLKLFYSYKVNNVNYKNNKITTDALDLKLKNENEVNQFIKKWRKFGVFYNPNNPKKSVLIKSKINYTSLILLFFLSCLMSYFAFLSLNYTIIFAKKGR